MKIKSYFLMSLMMFVVLIIISCQSDDDDDFVQVPLRDRTEQQVSDKDSLIEYLNTHYYNKSFFETGTGFKIEDIIITELPKDADDNYLDLPDPENNMLLINAVEIKTTTFEETVYEYYILRLNQGSGTNSPEFTDKVRVLYEGSFVEDGDVFESSLNLNDPSNLNLVGNPFSTDPREQSGTITGWQRIFPEFNPALDPIIDGNGNIIYENYGLGVMFLPSGLAYFGSPVTGIPVYSNLIFKFALLQVEENDHDNDGIPSYIEDLDGDLDVFSDDTDEDNGPNYLDFDDDNDGVATIDELIPTEYIVDTTIGEEEPLLNTNEYEISRSESNGVITINTVTIADSNNDGVPDYLDEDITINYNEVSN